VTLTGGTVSNNGVRSGRGGSYVLSVGSPGLCQGGDVSTRGSTLAISSSTLSGNSDDDDGGLCVSTGTVTIGTSTLSSNAATNGGGLSDNGGTVTVDSCTLSGNNVSSPGHGGAIDNNARASALTVSNSAFSNNYVYFYNTPDNLFGPYTNGGGNAGLP
jgi:hypothetical protein